MPSRTRAQPRGGHAWSGGTPIKKFHWTPERELLVRAYSYSCCMRISADSRTQWTFMWLSVVNNLERDRSLDVETRYLFDCTAYVAGDTMCWDLHVNEHQRCRHSRHELNTAASFAQVASSTCERS